MPTGKVYEAITAITEALGKDGIAKTRKGDKYMFRGIDDIYNSLSSELAKNKLCILPVVLERDCVERQAKSGSSLFYVTVKVRFDFVSAEDGSTHQVVTLGEAMDSSDKATNKAMSAAYKYAALMTFCIPTEGDNDSENHIHEVVPDTRSPLADDPRKALVDKATAFAKHLDSLRSQSAVTDWVAQHNTMLFELRKEFPKSYENLSQKINQISEAFNLAGTAP